ncbi:MAG TPA: hypothetical protein VJ723_14675 [Candidatus Angelobacter sp.]|nr:hypothetical protein [Candidatus Angelobacter sp.]
MATRKLDIDRITILTPVGKLQSNISDDVLNKVYWVAQRIA